MVKLLFPQANAGERTGTGKITKNIYRQIILKDNVYMADSNLNGNFKINSPRSTIEIVLPDGRVYTGERGATLEVLLQMLPEWDNPPIMGAVVNGELKELTSTIEMDARIRLITMQDDDGARIYRRSITFLLEAAFEELFPDHLMTLDHSVSAGGYYCQVSKGEPLTNQDLNQLRKRMRELVDANLPFERQLVPLAEVVDYFNSKGFERQASIAEIPAEGISRVLSRG